MEEWKIVSGFSDYKVSNQGRIYSVRQNKIMKLKSNGVYKNIALHKDGTPHYRYIHRLVAMEFCSNPQNKPMVNHLDGDKLNNNYWNLEWVTKGENQLHAYKIGLRVPSENQRLAVITENKRRAAVRMSA
jgi:hypothetical protein